MKNREEIKQFWTKINEQLLDAGSLFVLEKLRFFSPQYSNLGMLQMHYQNLIAAADEKTVSPDLFYLLFILGHQEDMALALKQYPAVQIEELNKNGVNLLHCAAFSMNLQSLIFAWDEFPNLRNSQDSEGRTVMHHAASNGKMTAIQYLDQEDPKLSTILDHSNRTVLHYAASTGKEMAIAFLSERFSNLKDQKDIFGKNFIDYAVASGDHEAMKTAVKEFCNINDKGQDSKGRNVLLSAAASGNLSAMTCAWQEFPELHDSKDAQGRNALHHAANALRYGSLYLTANAEIVVILEFLLKQRPDLKASKDFQGKSLLHYAEDSGVKMAIKVVLEAFFEIKPEADDNGQNALHKAAALGHRVAIKYVLEKFPNLKLSKDNAGRNVLDIVAVSGDVESIRYVWENFPELRDERVIHNAYEAKNPEAFRCALELYVGDAVAHGAPLLDYLAHLRLGKGTECVLNKFLNFPAQAKGRNLVQVAAASGDTVALKYAARLYPGFANQNLIDHAVDSTKKCAFELYLNVDEQTGLNAAGENALHAAAYKCNSRLFALAWLSFPEFRLSKNKNNRNVIDIASDREDESFLLDVLRLFLNIKPGSFKDAAGRSIVIAAAYSGDVSAIEVAMNFSSKNKSYYLFDELVCAAASSGQEAAIRYVVENSPQYSIKEEATTQKVLSLVLASNNVQAINYVLKKFPTKSNYLDMSLLHVAMGVEGRKCLIEHLMDEENPKLIFALLNQKNADNKTPDEVAVAKGATTPSELVNNKLLATLRKSNSERLTKNERQQLNFFSAKCYDLLRNENNFPDMTSLENICTVVQDIIDVSSIRSLIYIKRKRDFLKVNALSIVDLEDLVNCFDVVSYLNSMKSAFQSNLEKIISYWKSAEPNRELIMIALNSIMDDFEKSFQKTPRERAIAEALFTSRDLQMLKAASSPELKTMESFFEASVAYHAITENLINNAGTSGQKYAQWVIERYEGLPCAVDQKYAPEGKITQIGVLKFAHINFYHSDETNSFGF